MASAAFFQESILGVVNLTPDSFSDGNKLSSPELILQQFEWLSKRGATGFDVGAQSTAPGRQVVGAEGELARLQLLFETPVKAWMEQHHPLLSLDTYWPSVVEQFVHCLPHKFSSFIWNDVSGVVDDSVLKFLAQKRGLYVLCHNPVGKRESTQQHTAWEANFTPDTIAEEVFRFFFSRLKALPVEYYPHVILDPAFGFGKNAHCNWALLEELPKIHQRLTRELDFSPAWMIGISKKRFLRQKVAELTEGTSRDEFADSEIVHLRALDELGMAFKRAQLKTHFWWRMHDPFLLTSKRIFDEAF